MLTHRFKRPRDLRHILCHRGELLLNLAGELVDTLRGLTETAINQKDTDRLREEGDRGDPDKNGEHCKCIRIQASLPGMLCDLYTATGMNKAMRGRSPLVHVMNGYDRRPC